LASLVRLLPEETQGTTLDSFIDAVDQIDRPDLLHLMPAFFPIVASLEGCEGLRQIRRAICDTSGWFP
jgi:hypothetical protein